MGYAQSAFCQICCVVGDAANVNILLILNLENDLKISDVSVLLLKKNLIPVSTTVLLLVSNSLCSFPSSGKSLLKGISGFSCPFPRCYLKISLCLVE